MYRIEKIAAVKMENSDPSEQPETSEHVLQQRDQYCFGCHKVDTKLNCSACCRSYHKKCAKINRIKMEPMQSNENVWRCPECIDIDMAISSPDKIITNINALLNHTVELLLEDTYCRRLKRPLDEISCPGYSHKISHPMDLDTIQNKVQKQVYKSARHFLADIKWIYHNSHILFEDNERLIAAKWLLKLSKEEVLSINTCTDCYENSYADSDQQPWFTRLCTKPHLLLWVKQRGCPFWPAKLLAVDGSTVSVRFFGKSHGRADVPAINCQLYSQTNPSKACLKKHVDELSYAQKEVLAYMDNFKEKYGTFNFLQTSKPFYASKLAEYLADTMGSVAASPELEAGRSELAFKSPESVVGPLGSDAHTSTSDDTCVGVHKVPKARKSTKRSRLITTPPTVSTAPKKRYYEHDIHASMRYRSSIRATRTKCSPVSSPVLYNPSTIATAVPQIQSPTGHHAESFAQVIDDSTQADPNYDITESWPNASSTSARCTRWESNINYSTESNDLASVFDNLQSTINDKVALMGNRYKNQLKHEFSELLDTAYAAFKAHWQSKKQRMATTIADLEHRNRLLTEENDRIKALLHEMPVSEL